MDAAHITKKTAPFLAVALLLAGAASAQTLTTSLGSNPTVTLSSLGQTQVTVQVLSSDGTTPISFGLASSGTWYTVSSSAGVTPATLTIRLRADCSTGGNTCTGGAGSSITLTGSGSFGTQTINVLGSSTSNGGNFLLAVDQNPVTLSTTFAGGVDSRTVNVTTTSAAAIPLSTQVTQGATWLTVVPSALSIAVGAPVSLSIFANSQNLALNATYQGAIVLTPNNNSTQALTISVTFTVGTGSVTGSLVPSTTGITFGYPNGNTSAVMSVTSNTGTTAFTASSNSVNGWLLVNGTTQTGAIATGLNNVFLSVNTVAAASLPTNVYTGTVTFTNANNLSDVTQISVTLSVNGASGGGITSGAAPTSLSFSYQQFKPSPPCQTVVIPSSGTYTITATGNFFTSGNSEFSGPGNILVCAAAANLAPGSYNGAINITPTNGFGISQSIPASLTVYTGPVVNATVNNVSGTVTCNFQSGGGCNDATMTVTASDNSALPITITPSVSWITIAGAATQTPGTFLVHLNPSGLPNGVNTANIQVNASGSANNTITVPVVVVVNGNSGGSGGTLTLGASSLTFNTAAASSQVLSVSAPSSTVFTVSTSSSGCGWLSVSPSGSLTTNQNLVVSVSPAGLTPGQTYSCNISLVANGITQTVPVSYTVPLGAGGNVTSDKPSLTFTAQVGISPTPQTLTISSASGSAPVSFTVTPNSTGWLSVNTSGGTTPLTISVSVDASRLTVGAYSGSITITPTGGNAIQIPVSLSVTAATVISATPTSLSFSYTAGGSNPADQSIQVSGTGQNLPFSAQVTSGADWLGVSPASGTAPQTITVRVSPGNLQANQTYNGTIVVSGTGTATGSTTINVTLTVSAPLPTIVRVTNAASFNNGAIAAGEIITIFGTALGPQTLQTSSQFATTVAGVQVTVGGYPAPLIYVRNDQIAAIVPYEINRPFIANPTVIVKFLGQGSNGITLPQAAAAPGIFTVGSGTGQGAILNQNLSVNSAANPANKGDVVVIYVTGEGQTNPPGVTGKLTTVSIVNGAAFTPQPLSSVTVTIDGLPAQVQFYGEAPNLVSGVLQLNVQIPAGARSGDRPIVVSIGGTPSQTDALGVGTATVAVR